ncbi:YfcE family phosphodiesterase [Macrococcus equi]|uniref:YfcE family phosphodiesterase n=1 Tax=Macrococcus equi TaxID=3395462 RepID=UPI0039BE5BE6
MKLVVVSDNHSLKHILTDIVAIHDDADVYIHLGDSEFDYRSAELREYIKIRGNCDYSKDFHEESVLQLEDVNLFLTHGHLYHVGQGREMLAKAAQDNHCKIALYGHLHVKRIETIDNVICINPGSIAQSRSDDAETYAILELKDNELKVSFYNQQHQLVENETLVIQ